ncbi:MBL fold metallo-hydrolase [Candidatus Parcubacteria bacterium]|nr:MBL fold metallo-hydrolase [Candidatus Parcubacteria bacterium]
MKLCFMGSEVKNEEIEDIDILFIPVALYKAAVALEPSAIIPMGYDKAALTQFLKEAGEKDAAPQDKLVVKKKDLDGKEGEIIVLKEE